MGGGGRGERGRARVGGAEQQKKEGSRSGGKKPTHLILPLNPLKLLLTESYVHAALALARRAQPRHPRAGRAVHGLVQLCQQQHVGVLNLGGLHLPGNDLLHVYTQMVTLIGVLPRGLQRARDLRQVAPLRLLVPLAVRKLNMVVGGQPGGR